MTGLETILAFLVVMGVISLPLTAIITRKNSPIGQALADRIRRKTEIREAAGRLVRGLPTGTQQHAGSDPTANRATFPSGGEDRANQLAMLENQQSEIQELSHKIDFLQRLIEKQHEDKA